jgi:hypothetical protein
MAAYKPSFKKSVQKDLDVIPKNDLQRILNRIEALAENPHPPGWEKLTGQNRYRLRQGRFHRGNSKSSIHGLGVLYKSGVYGWRVLCLTPGGFPCALGRRVRLKMAEG